MTPVSISYGYSPSATDNAALGLNCVLSLVTSGLGLWVLIELGFMKGTAGPNQYGPDPTMPAYMQGYQVPGQPGPAPMGYNQPGTGQAWYEQPGGTPGEAGVSSGQIKECKHCGEAIEAEAAFCKYCGRAQT